MEELINKKIDGITYRYRYFENESRISEVHNKVFLLRSLFPYWVSYVEVREFDMDDDCIASIVPEPIYKRITINIYSIFHTKSENEQICILVHELCHSLLGYLTSWCDKTLFSYENKDLESFVKKEYQDRVESVTEELALIFCKLFEIPLEI